MTRSYGLENTDRAEAEPDSAVRPRLLEGRYALQEPLGFGAMGVVHRAEDVSLGRDVAIKLIDPKHAEDPRFRAMLRAEARALARLRHENIVDVYSFGEERGAFYLVMEYVRGTDLDTLIARRTAVGQHFDVSQALDIVKRVGSGLAAVHATGLVHRDIKPSNILVEHETSRAVLVDFGVAHVHSATRQESAPVGTPGYMPPEQAAGVTVGPQADIYALACTTFELLTGRLPFESESGDVTMPNLARVAPRLSSYRAELVELDHALSRALANDPAARHSNVTAFIEDLDACSRRTGIRRLRLREQAESPAAVMKLVVLERDETLLRWIARLAERLLGSSGDVVQIERVRSPQELESVIESMVPDMLVIDEGSAGGDVSTLLGAMRSDARPEVLVLRKSFEHLHGGDPGFRELAKPLNAHVVGAVLAKMAARITERRHLTTEGGVASP